jgi:hypothetical protein
MRSTSLKATLTTATLVSAGVLLTAGSSPAATVDVYLRAESSTKTLPGGATVPMWGFVCASGSNPNCVPSTSGAPRINAAAGDDLTIHLTNTLPTPVSIVIPGQAGGGDPTWTMDAQSPPRRRVHSLTSETAAGTTATPGGPEMYTWTSLRPGTYLFHSGTQPSIQVPMGLYGALVVGGAGGTCSSGQSAYPDPPSGVNRSCHDAAALVVFGELDPVQNQRVADAVAAHVSLTNQCVKLADWIASPPPGTIGYPCTVNYNPTYFLVNGAPYDKAAPPPPVPAGAPSNRLLLRLVNAGLRSHAPVVVSLDTALIAEDGNPYPGLPQAQVCHTKVPVDVRRHCRCRLRGPLYDSLSEGDDGIPSAQAVEGCECDPELFLRNSSG